jgi:hypothetical protein
MKHRNFWRRVGLGVVLALSASCDPTTRKLSGSDCKPRKLTRLDSCVGEDRGFQECLLYFRASGVPERSWCEALGSPPISGELDLPRCDWSSAATLQRVACERYNIRGAARCFACAVAELEASRTYVYAYDASCTRSIEQVTCNVSAAEAAAKLGPASL